VRVRLARCRIRCPVTRASSSSHPASRFFERGLGRSAQAGTVTRFLLTRDPPTAIEGGLCAALMIAIGFAVYGAHVVHGGFLSDDWYIASQYQAPAHSGFGVFRTYMSTYGQRPVSALYLLTAQAVFGQHSSIYLAWAVVLAALVSSLLFVLLRQLGMERVHAAAIAALVILFPTADATVLWVSGSNGHVDISLYLVGAIVALHGLRKSGRSALGWHAAAVALYMVSILFAETTAGPIFLSVFLYRLRVPWKPAAKRWAVDVAAALVAVAVVGSRTHQPILSIHAQWERVRQLATGATRIVELAGLSTGPTRVPGFAIIALGALGAIAWFVLPRAGAMRADVGRWLLTSVAGIVAIAAGYLMYVPAASYYAPDAQGIGNRVNALAALGYATLFYASAVLISLGLRAFPNGRLLSIAGALALGATVAVLWIGAVTTDQSAYTRAFALADHSLHVIDRRIPKPPTGTTIYTFGLPKETSSVVPVWDASWDLTGALRMLWHDHTVHGIPSPTISTVRCKSHAIEPVGGLYIGDRADSPYGRAVFVDVASQEVRRITSRPVCEAAAHRFVELTVHSENGLPRALRGRPYLRRLQVTGGTPPYQWLVTSGALPPGMSLWSTGQLTGTAGAAGLFRFQVTAIDSAQAPGRQTSSFVLRVSNHR
jgi:hypothetical protein